MPKNTTVKKPASRLSVIEVIREVGKRTLAMCQCQCGTKKKLILSQVKRGDVKSCGCLMRESSAASGRANRRHGQATPNKRGRTYRSWESMKSRCLNPNSQSYKNYGGRGITVCLQWVESFDRFLADMGERPPNTSLDRIDNDGNYEPANCRWGTPRTQSRNKNNGRVIIYQGRSMLLVELSELTGVKYGLLYDRIVRHGWSVEKSVSTPPRIW